MTQKVINLTAFAQFPDLKSGSGERSSIRVMPRGRCDTPPGYVVDPNWLARNPNQLRVVAQTKAVEVSTDTTEA